MATISILKHKSDAHSINQNNPNHKNHTKNASSIHHTICKSLHQDNYVTIPEFLWQIWAHRMHIWNLLQSSRTWYQLTLESSWLHQLYTLCLPSTHVCTCSGSLQPVHVHSLHHCCLRTSSETRVSELPKLSLSRYQTYRNFDASMRSSSLSLLE